MRWTMRGVGITCSFACLWIAGWIGLELLGVDIFLAEVLSGLVVMGLMAGLAIWEFKR